MHVHFIGICGCGTSVAAVIAKRMGFEVSGCDLNTSSYYSTCLLDNNIPVYNGHDTNHLEFVDVVAYSDAVLINNAEVEELQEAKKRNIAMPWQAFMAQYLQRDKTVIAIAGTHGKTTTTIMVGSILNATDLGATTAAGTIYSKWNSSCIVSKSKYFVCEADEYRRHFLFYRPYYVIINNIELEHIDYFQNIDDIINAYAELIEKMHDGGCLVVNADSDGIQSLLLKSALRLKEKRIKVIAYHNELTKTSAVFPFRILYAYTVQQMPGCQTNIDITYNNCCVRLRLNIHGDYNAENAMSAFCIAAELGIDDSITRNVFESFDGVGQRFELIMSAKNLQIYDDYAHHPSELLAVLKMCRIQKPYNRICAVFEPPLLSRTQYFFPDYVSVLCLFDEVLLLKTYKGRESHSDITDITENQWREQFECSNKQIYFFQEREDVPDFIAKTAKAGDIYIMFSGHLRNVAEITAQRLEKL